MLQLTVESPIGALTLTEDQGAITALRWGGEAQDRSDLLRQAALQLQQYFAGERQDFNLALRPDGSEFQRRICQAMRQIPFGRTATYGSLAKQLDCPAQAVGQGCSGNPIPILIPCHRVLSSTGLGGFSGGVGVETKVWLLKHEGAASLLI